MVHRRLLLTTVLVFVLGCQSAYYKTMETFGHHKRDILVDRVEDARDAQEDAKDQFKTALERFNEVVAVKGGDLQDKYNSLKTELDRSESKAKAVTERIDKVSEVADDLFKEWVNELDDYTNKELRRSSEAKLRETQARYDQLISAMRRAESKIEPVLVVFRDQVLYLKHNLNAQAIASLQGELTSVETDVAELIREMEASIAEADSFISSIGG